MQQLSLLEQSRLEDPAASDEDHVAALAESIIVDAGVQPPIRLDVIASFQGISQVEVRPQPWAGCLIPLDDKLVIRLRETDSRKRRRFSGFHEVTHTFLPGFHLAPQFRCDPGVPSKRTREELLCDTGASELLFPRRFFDHDLAQSSFGMTTVEDLSARYDASLEATARRVIDRSPEDGLLVVLEVGLKPSEVDTPNAAPKLRVKYSHRKGAWPFLPTHKSVDSQSFFQQALEEGEASGVTRLSDLTKAFDQAVEVSALSCGFLDNQGVVHERVLGIARKRKGGRKMRRSRGVRKG